MTNKSTDKKEWKNLLDHYEELKNLHLRDLFTDKNRINDFHIIVTYFLIFQKIEFQQNY